MSLSLSRKQKKELKKLQQSAAHVWEAQQVVAAGAADVARQAGRQLETFGRKQVAPAIEEKYHEILEPYVNRARPFVDQGVKASKKFIDGSVVPVAGAVVGKALSAWDVAAETRDKLARSRAGLPVVAPKKKSSAGPVIALILGIAAAAGVLYAAWQTLRADDELWVADDPLAAPDA
ncbi:DNA helicase [Microbacterium sp. JZ37]|uniref:DNA helicase n=1 Tax=Microbacterium sp. JZ37 TaxID=2654193 RepID=UPI002B475D54|nr:DNA helicase [Microbacterium sp. JZ37]